VELQCTNANVALCGTFYAADASPVITLSFGGTIPTDQAAAKPKVAAAVAAATGYLATQVTNIQFTATRRSADRRSGYKVSFQIIPANNAQSPAIVAAAVATAAASPALNNAFAANLGDQVTGVTVGSAAAIVPPAATTTTRASTGTPAPGASDASATSTSLVQVAVAAVATTAAFML